MPNMGTVPARIKVHRFFQEMDGRNWHRVEVFFKYRDVNLTGHEHVKIYSHDLETISKHKDVPQKLQARAATVLRSFVYDDFVGAYLTLTKKAEGRHAEVRKELSVQTAQWSRNVGASSPAHSGKQAPVTSSHTPLPIKSIQSPLVIHAAVPMTRPFVVGDDKPSPVKQQPNPNGTERRGRLDEHLESENNDMTLLPVSTEQDFTFREGSKIERHEVQQKLAAAFPSDQAQRKLWAYLVNAVEHFPIYDSTKEYSESVAIASYILPLCRVFIGDPDKMAFLNFVDTISNLGDSRSPAKSNRRPDIVLELKDRSNQTLYDLGIGEVTSFAQQSHQSKNAKDLVRIGHSLKDALDRLEDRYNVTEAFLIGFQVIAQTMSIYIMSRCGNMYLMVHQDEVTIPDSVRDLGVIGSQYRIWHELKLTVLDGIKPVIEAAKDYAVMTTGSGNRESRFPTLWTPEVHSFFKDQP
ncbi:hypothetical protein BGX28_001581 [Mortierella sp. GBA30]|nr:hypothetical protein BGX28_001581 [Mortierella sp. GBA30]